jgi:hypothetical protein
MKLLQELYEKYTGHVPVSKEDIAKVYHNDYLKQKKKHQKAKSRKK